MAKLPRFLNSSANFAKNIEIEKTFLLFLVVKSL